MRSAQLTSKSKSDPNPLIIVKQFLNFVRAGTFPLSERAINLFNRLFLGNKKDSGGKFKGLVFN